MNLNWDNNLATGIVNIDNQHKELFDRINKLLIAMKEGKGKDEVIGTLNFLEDYVIKHFTEEEEIQKKIIILNIAFNINSMKSLKKNLKN